MSSWARTGARKITIKVCFVALYAYSLFDPSTRFVFGGSEVRAWQFANGLSRRPGFDVSFTVFDHGQPDVERFNGIAVHKHFGYQSYGAKADQTGKWGLRWAALRDILARAVGPGPSWIDDHPVEPIKHRVYGKIDADVYCGFGVNNLTAELAAYCRDEAKRFILLAGSDIDFSERYLSAPDERNSYGNIGRLCTFAIAQADTVITQTRHQLRLLEDRYGREGKVISNPIDLTADDMSPAVPETEPMVLWVGKSDRTKCPEILLALARRFPDTRFLAVINKAHDDVHEATLNDAPANVEIVEQISYPEIEGLYRRSRVLVNTSSFEGFPNTFLQAGKLGVPVLSLVVDPDDFITRHGCGIVAGGDVQRLAEGLRTLLDDRKRYEACSKNIRAYVGEHHDLRDKVAELEAIILANDG